MILFPAIDIKDGHCVRLVQGDFGKKEIYGDPQEMAKRWQGLGAEWLHIVDLDGALEGGAKNATVIKALIESVDVPVQVGGGIRNLSRMEDYLRMGASRVILGSAALKDEEFLNEAIAAFGEAVAVSVDAKGGFVATDGWTKISRVKASDFVKHLAEKGVRTIIYTDIARDGMLSGPNFAEIAGVIRQTNMNVIASGGISSLEDIKKLAEWKVYGAIIGKALYTGQIDFALARKEVAGC